MAQLNPKEVKAARAEKKGYVRKKDVWTKITRAEVQSRGLQGIKVRRIDINKGGGHVESQVQE